MTGVVSFGPDVECGSSTDPGVYTKILSFESIIKEVLMDSPNFYTNTMKEYPGLKAMKLWKEQHNFWNFTFIVRNIQQIIK